MNRIFRTDTFNLIRRRYQEDKIISEHPDLKDVRYNSSPKGDQQLITRLSIHKKFRYAVQIKTPESPSLTKPLNIHQSASKSIHSRSPLIASFFPSSREQLFTFARTHSVRDKIVSSMGRTRSTSFRKWSEYNLIFSIRKCRDCRFFYFSSHKTRRLKKNKLLIHFQFIKTLKSFIFCVRFPVIRINYARTIEYFIFRRTQSRWKAKNSRYLLVLSVKRSLNWRNCWR